MSHSYEEYSQGYGKFSVNVLAVSHLFITIVGGITFNKECSTSYIFGHRHMYTDTHISTIVKI